MYCTAQLLWEFSREKCTAIIELQFIMSWYTNTHTPALLLAESFTRILIYCVLFCPVIAFKINHEVIIISYLAVLVWILTIILYYCKLNTNKNPFWVWCVLPAVYCGIYNQHINVNITHHIVIFEDTSHSFPCSHFRLELDLETFARPQCSKAEEHVDPHLLSPVHTEWKQTASGTVSSRPPVRQWHLHCAKM